MKDNDSAFPVFEEARVNSDGSPCTAYVLTSPGMTLKQYAAIQLRVPRSGDSEIDAMIRESRRAEFAGQAMKIITDRCMTWPDSLIQGGWQDYAACESFVLADAMLAEWEKEAEQA
jgi:hypothetical protein